MKGESKVKFARLKVEKPKLKSPPKVKAVAKPRGAKP
jgi:hypothetical protein